MEFLQARAQDAPDVLKLYQSCIGLPGCTWNEYYPTDEDIQIDRAQGALYILRDGDAVIGAVSAGFKCELDGVCPWQARNNPGEIGRLCISPARRGEGLGARLLREALMVLRAKGFDGARLLVSPENPPALRLYKSAGFTRAGEAELYERRWQCMETQL